MWRGMYLYSVVDAREAAKSSNYSCFGTVIYVPSQPVIDFGQSQWPSPYDKSKVCPRILLITTWTDGKFGFVGGGRNKKKDTCPLDTMNREFAEEMGTPMMFTDENFCFASSVNGKMTFVYAIITHDESVLSNLLSSFYATPREAYLNEVMSAMAYPLWIEGPDDVSKACWDNNVWGLPRHLVAQGGMFSPTLGNSNLPREHFLLLLHSTGIVSTALMNRLFDLSLSVTFVDSRPLESFESFLTKTQTKGDDEAVASKQI